MTLHTLTCILVLLLLSSLSSGCADRTPQMQAEGALPGSHYFEIRVADSTVTAQLAVTTAEKAQGLMETEHLDAHQGMLFIYPRPQQASFWMRNTPIPLDIGFFNSQGVLLEVYPMYPYDESSVKSTRDNISFALEMNQGWFAENDIRPGSRLNLEDVRDALTARGFDPAQYSFPEPKP